MIIIPLSNFEPETLNNLIEEITTRDGTDYGEVELTQQQKVEQVLQSLRTKQAYICFDPVSETTSLIAADEARQMGIL